MLVTISNSPEDLQKQLCRRYGVRHLAALIPHSASKQVWLIWSTPFKEPRKDVFKVKRFSHHQREEMQSWLNKHQSYTLMWHFAIGTSIWLVLRSLPF